MSIDLVVLAKILLLLNPSDVLLSVCAGVSVCGWPISFSVLRIGTSVLAFKNNAPSSVSAANDITLRIIVDRVRMVSLLGGFHLSFHRKWWPPERLRAFF